MDTKIQINALIFTRGDCYVCIHMEQWAFEIQVSGKIFFISKLLCYKMLLIFMYCDIK